MAVFKALWKSSNCTQILYSVVKHLGVLTEYLLTVGADNIKKLREGLGKLLSDSSQEYMTTLSFQYKLLWFGKLTYQLLLLVHCSLCGLSIFASLLHFICHLLVLSLSNTMVLKNSYLSILPDSAFRLTNSSSGEITCFPHSHICKYYQWETDAVICQHSRLPDKMTMLDRYVTFTHKQACNTASFYELALVDSFHRKATLYNTILLFEELTQALNSPKNHISSFHHNTSTIFPLLLMSGSTMMFLTSLLSARSNIA